MLCILGKLKTYLKLLHLIHSSMRLLGATMASNNPLSPFNNLFTQHTLLCLVRAVEAQVLLISLTMAQSDLRSS